MRKTGWEKKGEREVPEFRDFWHGERFMVGPLGCRGWERGGRSEGLGARGHGAEGWRGWKATTAALWLEIGTSWQAH